MKMKRLSKGSDQVHVPPHHILAPEGDPEEG